jgi:predicted acylesterase/phospholipase RssA
LITTNDHKPTNVAAEGPADVGKAMNTGRVEKIELPGPVGFVLGGGGSLGAGQVGMLRALAERGITPDLVVGTSVGSVNGALLARSRSCARCGSTATTCSRTRAWPRSWRPS